MLYSKQDEHVNPDIIMVCVYIYIYNEGVFLLPAIVGLLLENHCFPKKFLKSPNMFQL